MQIDIDNVVGTVFGPPFTLLYIVRLCVQSLCSSFGPVSACFRMIKLVIVVF